jgi:hypothetical protein
MGRCGRKQLLSVLRYIFLEGLKKTTKNLTKYLVSEPRIETVTSQTWSRSANHTSKNSMFILIIFTLNTL